MDVCCIGCHCKRERAEGIATANGCAVSIGCADVDGNQSGAQPSLKAGVDAATVAAAAVAVAVAVVSVEPAVAVATAMFALIRAVLSLSCKSKKSLSIMMIQLL